MKDLKHLIWFEDLLQQANEGGRVFFVSDPHGESRIFSQKCC